MGITPINLDITERLKDHAFAVEYVAAVEERLKSVEHALVRMVETAYEDDATRRASIANAQAALRDQR